jgi:hypothetical protein
MRFYWPFDVETKLGNSWKLFRVVYNAPDIQYRSQIGTGNCVIYVNHGCNAGAAGDNVVDLISETVLETSKFGFLCTVYFYHVITKMKS